MAVRNTSCSNCGSSDTYAFNTRFRPETTVVTEEDYRCRLCGNKFPVYYC